MDRERARKNDRKKTRQVWCRFDVRMNVYQSITAVKLDESESNMKVIGDFDKNNFSGQKTLMDLKT